MKDPLKTLKARAAKARATHAYRAEGASLHFTEDLLGQMKARGLTRSTLAGMIGTSPAYITKILRGDTNFTLDTMVKMGCMNARPSEKAPCHFLPPRHPPPMCGA